MLRFAIIFYLPRCTYVCFKIVLFLQSYVIKSAPWTILWFRILGIFSGEYIKRLCVFMFQTCSNSQLLRRVLWISAEQTIGASLKHKNTQPLYMFNRVRVLHLNRLKERTWLHSFAFITLSNLLIELRSSYNCKFKPKRLWMKDSKSECQRHLPQVKYLFQLLIT